MSAKRMYVSVTEAAKILHCHPVTIRRQIAAGSIPAIRVGRTWRIPFDSVLPETALAGPPRRVTPAV